MKIAAAVLAAACLVSPLAAEDAHKQHGAAESKTATLSGEVLDMSCYMNHEGKGPKHAKCAKSCALKGSPIGLLTADGQVYLFTEDHAKTKEYAKARELAAEQVKVTGTIAKKGGVQALSVQSIEKIK